MPGESLVEVGCVPDFLEDRLEIILQGVGHDVNRLGNLARPRDVERQLHIRLKREEPR
jgi:hypothetical protein